MAVTKGSDNEFPSVLLAEQGSDPATPAAGTRRLYVTSAGAWKDIDDTGAVTAIGVGFANPMTTSGDIIYGASSGTPTRLAKSTDGKVLTLASGIPSWATPASGFSDPMTTRGDVIVRNSSNATARLAIGSSGKVLSSDGTDVSWQTPSAGAALTGASYKRATGNYSITGTSFADVDNTNMNLTITTGAHRVMIGFVGTLYGDTDLIILSLDVTVDGTRVGGDAGLVQRRFNGSAGNGIEIDGSFVFLTDVLSAASHTFKLQAKVSANTGSNLILAAASAQSWAQFWVMEQGG